MIIQYDPTKKVYYHVPLADLVSSNGTPVRSFTTSQQMIDWVIQQFNTGKNPPYVEFTVVANGPAGAQISGPITNYIFINPPGPFYVQGADADILCGQNIIYDKTNGIRQSQVNAPSEGWGR